MITLSEVSQKEKDKYHVMSLKYDTKELIYETVTESQTCMRPWNRDTQLSCTHRNYQVIHVYCFLSPNVLDNLLCSNKKLIHLGIKLTHQYIYCIV